MLCTIALSMLVTIVVDIPICDSFKFVPPSSLTFRDDVSDQNAKAKKNMDQMGQIQHLQEKMEFLEEERKDTRLQLDQIKSLKEDLRKATGQLEEMKHLPQDMKSMNARLQKQCLKSDEMNSVFLGLLSDTSKYALLKFKESDMSAAYQEGTETFGSSRAIDGNKNPDFRVGSCTASTDHAPWWLGVLSERSNIHRVELTNRADCCGFRMNTISVEVFETDPRTDADAEPQLCGKIDKDLQLLVSVECEKPVWGKYLRVIKHKNEIFQLCEVEAFGFVSNKKFRMPIESSEVAPARFAIDSDVKTCSETSNNPDKESWWQVDVLGNSTVTRVAIVNRDDDKYTFLSDFKVSVHKTFPSVCEDSADNVCTHHKGTVGQGETVTLTCDRPMTGRFLRITKVNGGMLSLCDIRLLDREQ